MSKRRKILLIALAILAVLAGIIYWATRGQSAEHTVDEASGGDPVLAEPQAESIPTVNIADPVGWADGEAPDAAKGLTVTRFAEGLDHPRVLYTMPNGDVLATLTRAPQRDGGGIVGWIGDMLMSMAGATGDSPDQIVLMRDSTGDGAADVKTVLDAEGLSSPSGLAWADGTLYVANHDALLAFPYEEGASTLGGPAKKLMDLPPAGNHWMRNIAINPEATQIYVAVGSASNIGENGMAAEEGRAAIHEYDIEKGTSRVYAVGLRNPNGLDFNPWNGELWTTVNERDMLGSDLVPDYMTNVPIGAHYGWPWVYWKENVDTRVRYAQPVEVAYARKPEYALGPHVAALGLAFSKGGNRLGANFASGAVIARHGSWNRKPASGYDVVYVEFDERGNAQGKPVPLLTGFLKGDGETRGRPTWVSWAKDGALLVSDDTAGIIWRVIDPAAEPSPAIARTKSGSLPPLRELLDDPAAAFSEEFAREVQMPLN